MNKYDEYLSQYGLTNETLSGIDENGKTVLIDINENEACIRTLQKNKWIRKNVYHKDGTYEELYER
jgi:hypothetical protein